MAGDCIFCKIAQGVVPTDFLLETENVVAFRDLNPVAPTHVLVIPKKHIVSLGHIEPDDQTLLAEIMLAIKELATREELDAGFRVVANTGPDGGQSVHHLHFHLLGGRALRWPPG